MQFTSNHYLDTEQLARSIAQKTQAGDFLVLRGDLGAGKTTFVRGFANEWGNDDVSSPTFSIVHEYDTEPPIFHMDLYRLHGEEELDEIGYDEYTKRNGVIIMEWAERAESRLPMDRLEICLMYDDEESDKRRIEVMPKGDWVSRLHGWMPLADKGEQ